MLMQEQGALRYTMLCHQPYNWRSWHPFSDQSCLRPPGGETENWHMISKVILIDKIKVETYVVNYWFFACSVVIYNLNWTSTKVDLRSSQIRVTSIESQKTKRSKSEPWFLNNWLWTHHCPGALVINVGCSPIRSHHCQPSAFLYDLTYDHMHLLPGIVSSCCSVRPSQKASSGDISGTMCGIIDPLVS